MVRGIDKTDIFKDDQNRALFLERLGLNVSDGKNSAYAWVLMTNHVHILFKSGKDGISGVMRKLLNMVRPVLQPPPQTDRPTSRKPL